MFLLDKNMALYIEKVCKETSALDLGPFQMGEKEPDTVSFTNAVLKTLYPEYKGGVYQGKYYYDMLETIITKNGGSLCSFFSEGGYLPSVPHEPESLEDTYLYFLLNSLIYDEIRFDDMDVFVEKLEEYTLLNVEGNEDELDDLYKAIINDSAYISGHEDNPSPYWVNIEEFFEDFLLSGKGIRDFLNSDFLLFSNILEADIYPLSLFIMVFKDTLLDFLDNNGYDGIRYILLNPFALDVDDYNIGYMNQEFFDGVCFTCCTSNPEEHKAAGGNYIHPFLLPALDAAFTLFKDK